MTDELGFAPVLCLHSFRNPTMSASPAPEIIRVTGITNREFLDRFAREGRVGLSGGRMLIDRAISRAQRHVDAAHQWSRWSHAFLFQGRRTAGDQIGRAHVRTPLTA